MASWISKVCRACRNSPFIGHMVNLIDFHKPIHVSWFSSHSILIILIVLQVSTRSICLSTRLMKCCGNNCSWQSTKVERASALANPNKKAFTADFLYSCSYSHIRHIILSSTHQLTIVAFIIIIKGFPAVFLPDPDGDITC